MPPRALFGLLLAVALAFTWLAMGPCLDNGFVNWDESVYITGNPNIRSLSPGNIKKIFFSMDLKMYSPLSTLSYALNYAAGGLDPKVYHATDLALHLANTALVMALARLLFGGVWTAFFTALLFGIHPAHVESVAWAAERKDMLYSFFYLAAMTVYVLRGDSRAGRAAALFFFLCSLLSKPMAVTLPAALLLTDYLREGRITLRRLAEKTPFLLLAAVFAATQLSSGGLEMHWAKRLLVPFFNLGFYIYKMLWPFSLSAMYVSIPGGRVTIILGALAAIAGIALFIRHLRRDRELVFCALLYTVMLLPVLQFFPFGPVIAADRYTYLASVGFFSAAAVLALRLWERLGDGGRKVMAVAGLCLVFLLAVTARVRCAAWRDGISLWTDTLRKQPGLGVALSNLCVAYGDARMFPEAEACLKTVIAAAPAVTANYYNMATLLYWQGNLDGAEKYCLAALKLEPDYARALKRLGDVYKARGQEGRAERSYALAREHAAKDEDLPQAVVK